jgi:Ala-tRNA(Pro) deacylase
MFMIVKKLRDYLDSHHVKYVIISHSLAYTAQDVAAYAHIPGKEMAKTVMVKVDGKLMMAVLPASYHIQFNELKAAMRAKDVELANEREFRDLFPECEVGAMPPFGDLFGVDMLVAQSLTEDEEIAFNAGSHRELVRMAYEDYEKLANPKIVNF